MFLSLFRTLEATKSLFSLLVNRIHAKTYPNLKVALEAESSNTNLNDVHYLPAKHGRRARLAYLRVLNRKSQDSRSLFSVSLTPRCFTGHLLILTAPCTALTRSGHTVCVTTSACTRTRGNTLYSHPSPESARRSRSIRRPNTH